MTSKDKGCSHQTYKRHTVHYAKAGYHFRNCHCHVTQAHTGLHLRQKNEVKRWVRLRNYALTHGKTHDVCCFWFAEVKAGFADFYPQIKNMASCSRARVVLMFAGMLASLCAFTFNILLVFGAKSGNCLTAFHHEGVRSIHELMSLQAFSSTAQRRWSWSTQPP